MAVCCHHRSNRLFYDITLLLGQMKKTILIFFIFLSTEIVTAQCAMCKAVVESGDAQVAQGLNDGILYLMVFPYILVGALFYFIYRYKVKNKN
jgi:hypothetical protein